MLDGTLCSIWFMLTSSSTEKHVHTVYMSNNVLDSIYDDSTLILFGV